MKSISHFTLTRFHFGTNKTNLEEHVPMSVPRFVFHVVFLLPLPAKLCYELVVHSQSLAIVPFPKDGGEKEHGGEQKKRKVSLRFERSSFSPHFLFSSGFVFSFFFSTFSAYFFPRAAGLFLHATRQTDEKSLLRIRMEVTSAKQMSRNKGTRL